MDNNKIGIRVPSLDSLQCPTDEKQIEGLDVVGYYFPADSFVFKSGDMRIVMTKDFLKEVIQDVENTPGLYET